MANEYCEDLLLKSCSCLNTGLWLLRDFMSVECVDGEAEQHRDAHLFLALYIITPSFWPNPPLLAIPASHGSAACKWQSRGPCLWASTESALPRSAHATASTPPSRTQQLQHRLRVLTMGKAVLNEAPSPVNELGAADFTFSLALCPGMVWEATFT